MAALGSAGLTIAPQFAGAFYPPGSPQLLTSLCSGLANEWGRTLLAMQVTDKNRKDDYGGIWCPADKTVHGRVGDTIYPFFYLAHTNNDHRYIDASILLYRWIERRVGQPDGSWLNEPQKGAWLGTTVFMAIALCESLKNYGALMDTAFRQDVSDRLKKAGDFIFKTFNIDYGNINYPISAAYGLALLGEVLDVPAYTTRGRQLAHQALKFFTEKD